MQETAPTAKATAEPHRPRRESALQQTEKSVPAGAAGAAHRKASLPSATCPATCLRKPYSNTEGSPVAKTISSFQQEPQWENKGCNFPPAERKCVFLQLIFGVWSSPWRVRCQAGAQPGKTLVPAFPRREGGTVTKRASPPFGARKHTRVKESLHTWVHLDFSGDRR